MNAKRSILPLVVALSSLCVLTQAQEQIQSNKQQKPLIYGLVIDNPGSLRHQINQVIDTCKLIVNSNKSGDETFLVRFVDHENIKVMQDYTSGKSALIAALDNMYVGEGSTAIIDAVYFSARHLAQSDKVKDQASRRLLILITDGEDRSSHYRLETMLALLREKDVRVYVIGLVQDLKQQRALTQARVVNFLRRIGEGSGGKVFFAESRSEVKDIAGRLMEEIRQQE